MTNSLKSVDVTSAREVLWYAGDTNLGQKIKPRQAALIHTIRCCIVDESLGAKQYLGSLRREFPSYVRLMEIAVTSGHGMNIEPLRRFVKTHDGAQLEVFSSQAGLASIRGGL